MVPRGSPFPYTVEINRTKNPLIYLPHRKFISLPLLLSHSLYSTSLTLHDELLSPLVPADETKRNNIDSWLTPITAAI